MRGTLQPYWSHSGWKIHPNAQAVEGPISRTGLTCQNLPLRPKMSNQCKKTAGCAGQGPNGITCLKKIDLLQPAGFLTVSDKPGGGHELCRFLSFYLPFSCWSLCQCKTDSFTCLCTTLCTVCKMILSILSWKRYKSRVDAQPAQHYPSLYRYLITSVITRLEEESQLLCLLGESHS